MANLDVRAIHAEHWTRHKGKQPGALTETFDDQEREFLAVIDRYKRENRRPFPTWSEVLAVVRALGYRQIESPLSREAAAEMVAQVETRQRRRHRRTN